MEKTSDLINEYAEVLSLARKLLEKHTTLFTASMKIPTDSLILTGNIIPILIDYLVQQYNGDNDVLKTKSYTGWAASFLEYYNTIADNSCIEFLRTIPFPDGKITTTPSSTSLNSAVADDIAKMQNIGYKPFYVNENIYAVSYKVKGCVAENTVLRYIEYNRNTAYIDDSSLRWITDTQDFIHTKPFYCPDDRSLFITEKQLSYILERKLHFNKKYEDIDMKNFQFWVNTMNYDIDRQMIPYIDKNPQGFFRISFDATGKNKIVTL